MWYQIFDWNKYVFIDTETKKRPLKDIVLKMTKDGRLNLPDEILKVLNFDDTSYAIIRLDPTTQKFITVHKAKITAET